MVKPNKILTNCTGFEWDHGNIVNNWDKHDVDTNKGEIIEYKEHQKAMSLDSVVRYLSNSGFDSIKTYNDFDRSSATDEDFSVFLCQKD